MGEIFNVPNSNVGYQYIFKEEDNHSCIGIKGGEFEGVVYKYGKVTLSEKENPDGTLPFRFEYDIVDNNGIQREQFGDEFFKLIGDILVEVMEEQIKDEPVNRKNSSK